MPDVNADQRRLFDIGGRLIIDKGGTLSTIKNKMPGTLEMQFGEYEAREFVEDGVPQNPLQGNGLYSTIRVKMFYTHHDTLLTSDLDELLRSAPATGLIDIITNIHVDLPNARGVTKWKRFTFANCFVVPGSLSIRAGTEFDELEVEFRSTTVDPITSNEIT